MDEEKIDPCTEEQDEPIYILPPHPIVPAPSNVETVCCEEPILVGESLPELIQKAVDELRDELLAELNR